MGRRSNLLLALLSAFLLSLSFSTFNLSFLVWVGLIPLFFALSNISAKQAFIAAYLCGLIFFLSSMYWLIFVTPAGWILLSLYQAIYIGLFGVFVIARIRGTKQSQPGISTYLVIPSSWCLLEYLRSHIGGGIGWNLMAYSQYENIPVIQIADVTGAYGVSFIVVLVNFAVFSSIKMAIGCQRANKKLFVKSTLPLKDELKTHPLIQTILVFAVTMFILAYGYDRLNLLAKEGPASKDLKAAVVQGNIEQLHKWDESYKEQIMEKYKELTLEAAKERPQLIIWPETSLPGYADTDSRLRRYIRDLTDSIKTPLLIGTPMTADYSSALLFSKDGKLLTQYDKLHLVAFGEFIPFERYLPFLRNILPLTGEFIPGAEYTIFKLSSEFGVLICFEDIFPDMVRRFVKDGADFMVNITNDAWFGESAAAYQHAANSVFRAVENRRPFIRSANTGLSCFIDRSGRIYSRVNRNGKDLFVSGFKANIIRISPDGLLTFYTRFGDIFVLFCALMTGVFLVDYLIRRRYNKKSL